MLGRLFVKYMSDKYADQPSAPIEVPPGGRFTDMAALKGSKRTGDMINTIIDKLEERTMPMPETPGDEPGVLLCLVYFA